MQHTTAEPTPTILIVDDDLTCRRLSSFVLEDRYTVLTADNGQQALDQLSGADVALVITDLSMPGMGGIELLHHIRRNKDCDILPIIVLSGNIHENNQTRIREAGANVLLMKPVNPDDLVGLVQHMLAQRVSSEHRSGYGAGEAYR